jgi:monoamine oxidase
LLSHGIQAIPEKPPAEAGDVIVIGAGFAGLAAAHELAHKGYGVTVLEGRKRIGGRVMSLDDVLPGKTVEGGGELIGSNHPTWRSYASRFGLSFTTVDDGGSGPILLKGHKLTRRESAKLAHEMTLTLNKLADEAIQVGNPFKPWGMTPEAKKLASELDQQSLQSWIDSCGASPLCRLAVEVLLSTDNGVPAEDQSLLAVLAMIQGGGGEDFWTQTERFRCVGGNNRLAEELASPILASIHLGVRVKKVSVAKDKVVVTRKDGETFEARDVILAVPPSVWGGIEFTDPLPALRKPQMGKNVKCLMSFRQEFWRKDGLSANMTCDGPVRLTWHSTEHQEGPGHVLVGFSGAQAAAECSSWNPVARTGNYVHELEKAYTGAEASLVDTRFMNWPSDPLAKASYAFPRPNEVTQWGPTYEQGLGNLHFAGEHTCYAFMGYMEGALQSGVAAAKKLATRDGL